MTEHLAAVDGSEGPPPEHVVVRLSNSQVALHAAAVSMSQGYQAEQVLRRADRFLEWLRRNQ